MATRQESLREAAENAFSEVLGAGQATGAEGSAPAQATVPEGQQAGPQGASTPAGQEGSQTPEGGAQAQATGGADIPDTYFGLDLTEFDQPQRQQIVQRFEQQEQFVRKLMQQNAELRNQPTGSGAQTPTPQTGIPQPPAVQAGQGVSVENMTDDDLVRALGLSEDDPYFDVKRQAMVPLARSIVGIQKQMETMREDLLLDQTERYWETTLDSLEAQYGDLGVSRDDILEFAATNGIADPTDAYWRVAGPATRAVAEQVRTQRAELLRTGKIGASGVRPAATATPPAEPLKSQNSRDAIKEAAAEAAKELGTDWTDAVMARYQ